MDNQVKAAQVQGKYALVAAIIAAIISGLFNFFSLNYINKLLENVDKINSEKEDLSTQLIESKYELSESQKMYSDLEEHYNDIENQYIQLNETYNELERKYRILLPQEAQEDSLPVSNGTITDKIWIDQIDIFYQEGKHISGSKSEGWCKIWDSSIQKDSLGKEHMHGIYVRGYREDTYILEYILDDAYTGFKGLFTIEYEFRNTQIESNLKVYSIDGNGEKELLYNTIQPLHGGIKPISFDFAIYEADHIRIEISSDSGEKGEFFLALVDACFYK